VPAGYEREIGERNIGGGDGLRRPLRVVSEFKVSSGRGDVSCMSAFEEQ